MAKRRRDRIAGRHLEAHGNKFRVVLRVPPSLVAVLGKTKLKETLDTSSRAEADVMKWAALARLKQQIEDAKTGAASPATGAPTAGPTRARSLNARASIVREAMEWRREVLNEQNEEEPTFGPIVDHRIDQIADEHGSDEAAIFSDIVAGRATPFSPLVDNWLREGAFAGRTEAAYRQAVANLMDWCASASLAPTVEAITKRIAGRFVRERFIETNAAPATANKAVTALASFWSWMHKRGHTDQVSPWAGQSVSKTRRLAGSRDPGEASKRPFTDAEVAILLHGLTDPLLADFCRMAALTGMRREEIATLRVRHIRSGIIKVPGTKTAAAARDVPIHPDLATVIGRRSSDKGSDDFLFHELPAQTNAARGRGAPISQAFTRKRRALGIDDRIEGERQSRVDLHSFRRWFIRKAIVALEDGATGFHPWTIADVVGHSKEDGPLGMTMGRYPGRADMKALRSCVEAIKLPPS